MALKFATTYAYYLNSLFLGLRRKSWGALFYERCIATCSNNLKCTSSLFGKYKLPLVIYPYFECGCKKRKLTTLSFIHHNIHSWFLNLLWSFIPLYVMKNFVDYFYSVCDVEKASGFCFNNHKKGCIQISWNSLQSKWTPKYLLCKTPILLMSAFLASIFLRVLHDS